MFGHCGVIIWLRLIYMPFKDLFLYAFACIPYIYINYKLDTVMANNYVSVRFH